MIQMIKKADVEIEYLETYGDFPLPSYQTEGAAGFDFYAALAADETVTIGPGEWKLIPTGLKFAIPYGMELQVRPRSGLAAKFGVTLLNTPGTIDSDYRGEVKIIMINLSKNDFVIERGMRIAQGILSSYIRAEFHISEELSETERGSGGFGHTGV
jgi:dUTP pyrophosphatase